MICSRCKEERGDNFGPDKRKPSGLKSLCRVCECEIQKAYYARMKAACALDARFERDKTTRLARIQRRKSLGLCVECENKAATGTALCDYHRQIHVDKERRRRDGVSSVKLGGPGLGKCRRCGKIAQKASITWRLCDECRLKKPELQRAASKKYYEVLKDAAFVAYGGYRCVCCGETNKTFLTLDHINGDGGKHRRMVAKKQNQFLTWLKNEKYPPIMQVLCYNCNCGRARNGGVCPHQQQKVLAALTSSGTVQAHSG